MKIKKTSEKWGETGYAARGIAISSLCGALLCGGVMCLFAFLLSSHDLPLGVFGPVAVLSLILGCFISGFVSARIMNCRGMLWGGMCGLLLFLCLLASQGLCADAVVGISVLPKLIMMVTSGMIGGIFGVNFQRG